MTTRGERLGAYLLAKTGGRRGWQKALVEKSGVKRQTISKYTSPTFDDYPDLETLERLAHGLGVPLFEIVAAFEGADVQRRPPAILTDAERRRRRSWWLFISRFTAGLGLVAAREALTKLGFSSERGNLVTIWEHPREPLEPSETQLRALATIYRIPIDEFIDLWNNPPATDEEEMARRRQVPVVELERLTDDDQPRQRQTA
jgi:transcriptional regulator with XRE-family HTH domain